jgi:hypothetical protein
MLRQRRVEHVDPDRELGHGAAEGQVLDAFLGVAHGLEIGDEVGAVARGEAEAELAIEMRDDIAVGRVAPVVEIGRGRVGVEQGRRVEQAVRADVVAPPVDEGGGGMWHEAQLCRPCPRSCGGTSASPRRAAASPVRRARRRGELRVGDELELVHVGDQRVEDQRRRLGAGELADDDVARELAQRCGAAVAPVGRREADAAQARDVDRIEHEVVRDRIEMRAGGVDVAGPRRHAGNEEARIGVAVDVAGVAREPGRLGGRPQDRRRAERGVAELDEEGLPAAGDLRAQHLARLGRARRVEHRARRQRALARDLTEGADRRAAGDGKRRGNRQ